MCKSHPASADFEDTSTVRCSLRTAVAMEWNLSVPVRWAICDVEERVVEVELSKSIEAQKILSGFQTMDTEFWM